MIDYKKIIDSLDLDKISVKSVEEKEDYNIITIHGGLNGLGDIFFYLNQVDRIVCELSADKKDVWLISWENDCADDVWYLKLGVRDTKRKQTLLDSINNFSKAREAFVMKLLNSAQNTSEKLFVLEEIAVHNLLPLYDCICDVPLLDELTSSEVGEYISRHEAVYFHTYIDELCKFYEGQKTRDEIVEEIIEYVKHHKVIGAYYDW